MRTTVELPDALVEKAFAVSNCRTKTALFTLALEDLVMRHEMRRIKEWRGKVDLELDLDMLRKRRGSP
jgi:predicted transcriptional regulator